MRAVDGRRARQFGCRRRRRPAPTSASARILRLSCRRLVGSGVLERQRRRRRRRLDERARQLEAERVRHLLDLRQIAEVVQPEPLEELARRRIHERTADDLLAADGLDQLPLDERRQHAAAAADAADLGDLGAVIGCL